MSLYEALRFEASHGVHNAPNSGNKNWTTLGLEKGDFFDQRTKKRHFGQGFPGSQGSPAATK
jgi:hypothetical protein